VLSTTGAGISSFATPSKVRKSPQSKVKAQPIRKRQLDPEGLLPGTNLEVAGLPKGNEDWLLTRSAAMMKPPVLSIALGNRGKQRELICVNREYSGWE
jgi:hypothetical protein